MKTPSYIIGVVLFTSLLCATVAGFNYWVNPFLLFDAPQPSSLIKIKPEAADRARIFKLYQPIYYQPEVLLVGNSRIEIGLNPDVPALSQLGKTYNLGLPGAGIAGQLEFAQRVIDNSPVHSVIISVDYLDFLLGQNQRFGAYKLDVTELEDKIAGLLSLDALQGSLLTLFNQGAYASNRLLNGFNPAQDYVPILQSEGEAVLFSQKLASLASILQRSYWQLNDVKQQADSPLNLLKNKIHQWQQAGITVHLFINPYHDKYYASIARNGHAHGFMQFRQLMFDEFASITSFCDFTELGKQASQNTNAKGNSVYFWEPAHYKENLGNEMLKQLFSICR